MTDTQGALEYKCPNCGGALHFGNESQKLTCPYCDSEFDVQSVIVYNERLMGEAPEEFQWEEQTADEWTEEEKDAVTAFVCPACGGEIVTDANTAATFCPYCENPAILPSRLSGGIRPDAVIPFKTSKEDAKKAFLQICKNKPLLPSSFTKEHRIEKITGIYVPFWLYHCNSNLQGHYAATRMHFWSDSKYNYTRTDHYVLSRAAKAEFIGIPMDASKKMDDTIMESIEPFDYSAMVDFQTAYLSGYLADKYDVEAKEGEARIRQRVNSSMDLQIQSSLIGYHSTIPTVKNINITHSKAKYVLLPVWMLCTKYQGKIYTFAMNGQTGKMTGTFPICKKKSVAWFSGVCAAVTAIATAIQLLM